MFSVVIPLFNKQAYVQRALDSVYRQSIEPAAVLEIIVVNDGSTDGSDSIAKSQVDPRVRVIDQPNRGVSAARNAGIAAATEPFVAFLDADDRWLPEFLVRMRALIAVHPGALLYGSGFLTVRHGEFTRRHGIEPMEVSRDGSGDFFGALGRDVVVHPSSTVVPREAALAVGGFPEGVAYCEDYLFWCRLALRGRVVLSAEPLVEYDVAVPGQAVEYWQRRYRETFDVLDYHRFLADELRQRMAAGLTGPADASFAVYARKQLRTAALQRLYWGRFDALRTFWRELNLDGLALGRGGRVCGWVVRHPWADGIVAAMMRSVRTLRQALHRRGAGTST